MKNQSNNGKLILTYPFPEEVVIKPGISLKITVDENFPKDKVVTLSIRTKCTEPEKNSVEDDKDTIPGHPNCKIGECYDCHVVSCPIYQGYETIPTHENREPISVMELQGDSVPGHPNCKRSECADCHVVSCNNRL